MNNSANQPENQGSEVGPSRDAGNWARPVERLTVNDAPGGALTGAVHATRAHSTSAPVRSESDNIVGLDHGAQPHVAHHRPMEFVPFPSIDRPPWSLSCGR